VEVRAKIGFDSALPAAGVLITYVNETATIGPVRVMDANPTVSNLEEAVWNVGQTFTDNAHNLAVKVVEKTGNSYQITVTGNSQRSIPEGYDNSARELFPCLRQSVTRNILLTQDSALVIKEDEHSSYPDLVRCYEACVHF